MQYELVAGKYRAIAVEVGGGLRQLWYGDRPLLDGYAEDAIPDATRGQVLAPWPNRVFGGRWTWAGEHLELALSEPSGGNAIHGLVRWSGWQLQSRSSASVELAHRQHPQPGYPFRLDFAVRYSLDAEDGLTVELVATNPEPVAAPVALGMHPYLAAPDGKLVNDSTITVPAGGLLTVDGQGVPLEVEPVDGTAFDLRAPRRIGDLVLDHAYSGLSQESDGRTHVILASGDGRFTDLWMESGLEWLQLFTGDTLEAARRRMGIAVEPMTAPANALVTGTSLTVLEQGDSLTLRWGVSAGE